jgi:geranylgeranyl pyrophosphate synthase
LAGAHSADKNFLIQMLGNEHLTQSEFTRCKEIFVETGALKTAQSQAEAHVTAALDSLKNIHESIDTSFLGALVQQLLGRTH